MSVAVCDPKAFYPLRSLVDGPLDDLGRLIEVERFVRTVVLHDEISMEFEPHPYPGPDVESEWTEEEQQVGSRAVIVAFGPDLTGYDFFTEIIGVGKPVTPDISLTPALIEAVRTFSEAEEGNVYYKSHIQYLQRIVDVLNRGGSALLSGKFGSAAIQASSRYPKELFENLDKDWQQFARETATGELGFMVPPVLSIILTRCKRRDAIPTVLKELRDELADARGKVWALLGQLKTASTVAETQEIRQGLEAASRLLSPAHLSEFDTRPVRVLWDLIIGSITGAATTALVSDANPGVGAFIGAAITAVSQSVPPLIHELGPVLFGRGAFDLAKRVRQETMRVEYDALARLLTAAEKRKLGL